MNAFIVSNAMESPQSITNRILCKMGEGLRNQVMQIAGSYLGNLSALGRPAGLAKNIGSGLQDFFYEPVQGAMQSPQSFARGLGKGAKGLLTGVVGGALASTATIVESTTKTVSKGAAYVSGDADYAHRQVRRQVRQSVGGGGILTGLKDGGTALASGIASGMTGLVTKPLEEAKKGGAIGFVKGVGLGIIGVAAKPLMGVTEGLSQVAHGFSTSLTAQVERVHLRPPRVFSRSNLESDSELVLVPFSLPAAVAQAFVLRRATAGRYEDGFISLVELKAGEEEEEMECGPVQGGNAVGESCVVLSDRYFCWKRGNALQMSTQSNSATAADVLLLIPWGDISHCRLVLASGSGLSSSPSSSPSPSPNANPDGKVAASCSSSSGDSSSSSSIVELIVFRPYVPGVGVATKGDAGGGTSSAGASGGGVGGIKFSGISPSSARRDGGSGNSTSISTSINSNSSSTTVHMTAIACGSRAGAVRLYAALKTLAFKMGNGSKIAPLPQSLSHFLGASARKNEGGDAQKDAIVGSYYVDGSAGYGRGEGGSQSSVLPPSSPTSADPWQRALDQYTFGCVNDANVHKELSFGPVSSDDEILLSTQRHFASQCGAALAAVTSAGVNADDSTAALLELLAAADRVTWWLIGKWTTSHRNLNSSRCLALLIVNKTVHDLQLSKIEVQEGKNHCVLGAFRYEQDSRIVRANGAVCVFAFAFRPTLMDLSHVRVCVSTTAFTVTAATRTERTSSQAFPGFTAGFLEKSLTAWWGKYVLLIT